MENEYLGLSSLDNSQIEIIHELMFKEEKLDEFKTNLNKPNWKKMHQFINGCFFLYEAKEAGFPSHKTKKRKFEFCEAVRYVLIFTAIESIIGTTPYLTFEQWLKKKEKTQEEKKEIKEISKKNFIEIIENLFDIYRKKYGVLENIKHFFNTYVSEKNKKEIITSLYYENRNVPGDHCFKRVPKCFQNKKDCFELYGKDQIICIQKNNPNCILNDTDTSEFKQSFNSTISLLYDLFRNKIVHQGARSHFMEDDPTLSSLLLVHETSEKIRYVGVLQGLNINNFYQIIMEAVKEYYKKNFKENENTTKK